MDKGGSLERFEEANALYREGDYRSALELIEALDAAHPRNKNILYARARCCAKLGEYDAAAALCRTCVELGDAPRAKRLMEWLQNEASGLDEMGESETYELELDSWHSSVPVWIPWVRGLSGLRRWALVAIVILGTVAVWAAYQSRMSNVGVASSDSSRGMSDEPVVDLRAANEEYQAKLDELARKRAEEERKRIEEEDGPSTEPGLVISEEAWARTAVNGLPQWKPGIYREIVCPDSFYEERNGEMKPRTIDVYVPMAYQERPTELFPVVVMNWAGMNQGFRELENWAEENDVLIVVVNTACNRMYDRNWQAQDAALSTVANTMRVDTSMGFAMGMSGGAASCWEMICRYPNNFVGVVMMGMSRGHNGCWIPGHVRVGYIRGQTEHNLKSIKQTIPRLRSNGNKVREKVVPGGHVTGPLREREKMLSWMLADVRKERARLNAR